MTIIYIIIGGAVLFFFFFVFGYQILIYALFRDRLDPIDEEQKIRCHEALDAGNAPSRMCKFYIKRGFCPHGKCEIKK